MFDLLERNLIMTLNFPNRLNKKVVINFPEPVIYDLLKYHDLVKNEKYISAIKLMIPEMKENDFLSNPSWIINALSELIYWKSKKTDEELAEWDSDGFLPSTIDLMSNRYWVLPVDLMKKTTFSQLVAFSKWYEWNMNIQNWEEQKNLHIIMEQDSESDVVNEKDLADLKKSMKTFENMWGMPDLD